MRGRRGRSRTRRWTTGARGRGHTCYPSTAAREPIANGRAGGELSGRHTTWRDVHGQLARRHARAPTAGVVLVDARGSNATRRQLAIRPRSQAPAARRAVFERVQHGVARCAARAAHSPNRMTNQAAKNGERRVRPLSESSLRTEWMSPELRAAPSPTRHPQLRGEPASSHGASTRPTMFVSSFNSLSVPSMATGLREPTPP